MKRGHEEEQEEGAGAGSLALPDRRKRVRPQQQQGEEDEAACPPWRRFLPPYGPAASRLDVEDGDVAVAVLRDRVRRLCASPAAAVGETVELLVGRWARGRWGQQPLLPCHGTAAPPDSAGASSSARPVVSAAEGSGRRGGAWQDAQVSRCEQQEEASRDC